MAVDVTKDSATFKASVPKALFVTRAAMNGGLGNIFPPFAVGQNGQRFLISTALKDLEVSPMTVVVNWTAGLRK